jgi:hypothetical protein
MSLLNKITFTNASNLLDKIIDGGTKIIDYFTRVKNVREWCVEKWNEGKKLIEDLANFNSVKNSKSVNATAKEELTTKSLVKNSLSQNKEKLTNKDLIAKDIEAIKKTITKQVSTNDKKSFEKVSEILNNKNDSSFDYQKVAKIIDSSSLSSSVKGQFNKNLGYNQYQKMQDLVSNQEQVSRYQEIEQQAIENKILDQQPTEEQVINHQTLELQYQ